MSVGHSELGASGYKRWKACPGSVRLSRGLERKSSAYAEEGTKAHELAEGWLTGLFNESMRDPLNHEMLEAVSVYVDHVSRLREQRPTFERIEQKIDLVKYHPMLFGTADYVCYFAATKTLHVVDYKHGAGVPVEVEENGKGNVQLLYYAVGAMVKNPVPVKSVVATIVQPRCYHPAGPVRSYTTSPLDLLDFLADLVEDAKKTEDPEAPLVPSSECRWCAAKGICPALNKMALAAAQNVFSPVVPYEPQKLAETLSRLDQIEAWAKGVREFAYREAEAGREIPGYKLVDKRATRKWAPAVTPELLARELGLTVEQLYDTKLRSPAQIEKIVRKEGVEPYTVKESNGKNLVPCSDDRKPTTPRIRTVFEAIPEEER